MSKAFVSKLEKMVEDQDVAEVAPVKKVRKKRVKKVDAKRAELSKMSVEDLVEMLMISGKAAKPAAEKKSKTKRALTGYNLFTKDTYDSVRDLPSKERMAALAKKWNALGVDGKAEWSAKAKALKA